MVHRITHPSSVHGSGGGVLSAKLHKSGVPDSAVAAAAALVLCRVINPNNNCDNKQKN
jgi:hypothetical protein